jgi:hypothetical protein
VGRLRPSPKINVISKRQNCFSEFAPGTWLSDHLIRLKILSIYAQIPTIVHIRHDEFVCFAMLLVMTWSALLLCKLNKENGQADQGPML